MTEFVAYLIMFSIFTVLYRQIIVLFAESPWMAASALAAAQVVGLIIRRMGEGAP